MNPNLTAVLAVLYVIAVAIVTSLILPWLGYAVERGYFKWINIFYWMSRYWHWCFEVQFCLDLDYRSDLYNAWFFSGMGRQPSRVRCIGYRLSG